jgi:hypothetical protein
MSSKNYTAVEWLVQSINERIDLRTLKYWNEINEIVDQAKAMEKEQMDKVSEDWFFEGCSHMKHNKRIYKSFEDYYQHHYGQ